MPALASCATGREPALRPVGVDDVTEVADAIEGAEGIAWASDGRLIVSSRQSAVTILHPDGRREPAGQPEATLGMALDPDGNLVMATNGFASETGGPLKRLDLRTGETSIIAGEVEGRRLILSNWPCLAPNGDIYCTHSKDRDFHTIGSMTGTGYVFRVPADGGAPEIVADGLNGANGMCFSSDFRSMFVAITSTGTILKFTRQADGRYADPRQYGPQLGHAPAGLTVSDILEGMSQAERNQLGHPDGIALDVAGNLYASIPFANKILAITPSEDVVTILGDPAGECLQMPTSIAFGGADMRDLYATSMRQGRIVKIRTDIPGLRLPFS